MTTASILIYDSPCDEILLATSCLLRNGIDRLWLLYNGPDPDFKVPVTDPRIIFRRVANRGYGAGHNEAIREALDEGTDYHLVMNADVRWEGDVISPLVEAMEKDHEIGLMAPKVLNPDGSLQYSVRMLPTPLDVFARRFLPPKLNRKRDDRYLLKDLDHSKPLNVPYILGSFMLFRREALLDIGFFDERFFMYPEDIDISRRIHTRWKTLYYPAVSIIHAHRQASRHSRRMLRIHISNMIRYFNKWGWFFDAQRHRFNRLLRSGQEEGAEKHR